jgi:hypothetical protein
MFSANSSHRAEGASTPPARRYSRTAVTHRALQLHIGSSSSRDRPRMQRIARQDRS